MIFVDGNNWYHGLKEAGVVGQAEIHHGKVATKLLDGRTWLGTRYYIGKVEQYGNPQLYADQRRFVARLQAQDTRISVHYGRLERRPSRNDLANEMLAYFASLTVRIDPAVRRDLMAMAQRHRNVQTIVEKAVDVMLAVDLVTMAQRDDYDVAYILSADGDYTHAAQFAKDLGKRVFAVSAKHGAQLASVVHSFIRVDREWVASCYE